MPEETLNIGLIGCGYWGPNYVRLINDNPSVKLRYIQDLKEPRLGSVRLNRETAITKDAGDLFRDSAVNAVIIATPAKTHYDIVRSALCSGKDVLVEKPMTLESAHSKELAQIAESEGRVLMVGHIFEYNGAFHKLKEMAESGEIGDLRYVHAQRLALGPIRTDAGALWDLASHDVYMTTTLLGKLPEKVSCSGTSFNGAVDDINNLSMSFQGNLFATIYANWHYPTKVRTFMVAGSKKAVLFDDTQISEKLRVYDAGVDYEKLASPASDFAAFSATVREGDVHIPKLKASQPLEEQLKHFIACVRSRQKPLSDGLAGFRTVKILEAAESSRRNGGREAEIQWQ